MKNLPIIIIILWFLCFGPDIISQAQRKLSKDEIHAVVRTELERYRGLYEREHEARALAEEQVKIRDRQLNDLKATLFRLSR